MGCSPETDLLHPFACMSIHLCFGWVGESKEIGLPTDSAPKSELACVYPQCDGIPLLSFASSFRSKSKHLRT